MNARRPLSLAVLRGAVDLIDDGLIALLAARRNLVSVIGAAKARAGLPALDAARERRVLARAQALALRLGVPAATARRLLGLVIADARRQQMPAASRPPAAPPASRSAARTRTRARV
jgi:chorismate mutase